MEEKTTPKVSVIIPVYNVEQYLRDCLDSVINQTLDDIEIICINDGSPDNSLAILEEYAAKDARLRIISQENQGVSVARNKGIKASNAKYVTFLDSDDTLDVKCLELAYNNIIENKSNIVCFGINRIINGQGEPRWDSEFLKESPCLENIAHFMQNAAAKLFDNKFLKQNSILFPENIKTCEDGLFCLLCLYNNATFSYLDRNLYNYLIGRDGSACTQQKTIVETDIEAFKYILNTPDFNKAKEEFKIITIEKFFKHFRWNDSPVYRIPNYIKINKFIKYLNKNINKEILKKSNLKDIKRYNIFNLIIKNLFSVQNSPDKKKKIIMVLGIKISLKQNKYFYKKQLEKIYPAYKERYKKHIKELQELVNKRKIKVCFLCSETQKWNLQELYNAMERSEIFEPYILVTSLKNTKYRNDYEHNVEFFRSLCKNVKIGFDTEKKCSIDIKDFEPDIIFYQQPWEIWNNQGIEYASKFALTYYVPYTTTEICSVIEKHLFDFYYKLHKFFIVNELTAKEYADTFNYKGKNIVISGHPKLDIYKNYCPEDSKKEYIIYAPHYSIGNKSICYGTFDWNGEYILNWAKKHPEFKYIFKPHPRLKFALIEEFQKSQDEIENYYKEWEKIGIYYNDGDYFDFFKESKCLITDCGSFLMEYLPTKRPVIHLKNNMKNPDLSLTNKKIAKAYYQVSSIKELEKTMNKVLLENIDNNAKDRIKTLENLFKDKFNATEKILLELEKDLGLNK